eukprot:3537504-Amphidinium_carterae.1
MPMVRLPSNLHWILTAFVASMVCLIVAAVMVEHGAVGLRPDKVGPSDNFLDGTPVEHNSADVAATRSAPGELDIVSEIQALGKRRERAGWYKGCRCGLLFPSSTCRTGTSP